MKRLAACVLVILVVAVTAGPAISAPDPFTGAWKSIDDPPGPIGDLSNQTAAFGGGGATSQMHLVDDYATVCGGGIAVVSGTGTVSDNTLPAASWVLPRSDAQAARAAARSAST